MRRIIELVHCKYPVIMSFTFIMDGFILVNVKDTESLCVSGWFIKHSSFRSENIATFVTKCIFWHFQLC